MIVQNPLVPPPPTAANNAPSPVANAPAAAQNERTETARPVQPNEASARPRSEDRDRTQADRGEAPRSELETTVDSRLGGAGRSESGDSLRALSDTDRGRSSGTAFESDSTDRERGSQLDITA